MKSGIERYLIFYYMGGMPALLCKIINKKEIY